jgi:hypothetical protein
VSAASCPKLIDSDRRLQVRGMTSPPGWNAARASRSAEA